MDLGWLGAAHERTLVDQLRNHLLVTKATIRDYEPGDLGRVLDLWGRADESGEAGGLTLDQAVDLMNSGPSATVVAEIEGEIVGTVIGSSSAAIGWVHRLILLPGLSEETAIADGLLARIEQLLAGRGARRLGALVTEGERSYKHLERWDYRSSDASYLERPVTATTSVPTDLAAVWGRKINPGLWSELKGLEDAKQIIERRVILPLEEPALAARHSVAPPRAIVLFGPPGTGKTTFAKGIASRLGWPFVEIQPSEVAEEGADRTATLLAAAFDRILELSAAVVFVDEVEDLASDRHEERRVSPSVTNEFLKQIPRLREAPEHLLVCATNWVGRLDPAFLRPGRFDYVLPVGPPDPAARQAIWGRYCEEITDRHIDLSALVKASDFFTPADIEFAARKAAQAAFEREHFGEGSHRATTDEFLAAIAQTRPTLSRELVDRFDDDTDRFARY
jgi:transitional endoplasmic reticulum ATPase